MKEFSEDEKIIAKNIDKKYKWMARDIKGVLFVYNAIPFKKEMFGIWGNGSCGYACINSLFGRELFKSIKWEDDDPTRISDIYDPQILDDVEREYLKTILKPFHEKVDYVAKNSRNIFGNNYRREYLYIQFHDQDGKFEFPDFNSGEMYSGMELRRSYKLDELGITYTEDKA